MNVKYIKPCNCLPNFANSEAVASVYSDGRKTFEVATEANLLGFYPYPMSYVINRGHTCSS